MRTAEEIIKETFPDVVYRVDGLMHSDVNANDIRKAMKQYAKEALEAAAESARILYHDGFNKKDTHGLKYFQTGSDNLKPDKQSILNLIKELK